MEATIRGRMIQISDCDGPLFHSHTWFLCTYKCGRHFIKNSRLGAFHRYITRCPVGMHVDHINGNTLDNRRENLRVCTHQQNQWNRKTSPGVSRYKGVTRIRGGKKSKWMARVECNGERHSYGTYSTQLQAALAYDEAAVRLFGEYASPNFPERFKAVRQQQAVA